ncbi:MAG: ABC transporter permease subunit, partial [Bifidobacterium choerinum]
VVLDYGGSTQNVTVSASGGPVQVVSVPLSSYVGLEAVTAAGKTYKVVPACHRFALVYVNVRDGVRAIDPRLLELARAYRMPRHVVFTKILLRGVLPQFMTGLRFAITVSWIALVTCETVNSSAGIGYLLARAQQFFRTDQMVLCIVLYAALGLLSEWVVGALERLAHVRG